MATVPRHQKENLNNMVEGMAVRLVRGREVFTHDGKDYDIRGRPFLKIINTLRRQNVRPFKTIKIGMTVYAINPITEGKGSQKPLVEISTKLNGEMTKAGQATLDKINKLWDEKNRDMRLESVQLEFLVYHLSNDDSAKPSRDLAKDITARIVRPSSKEPSAFEVPAYVFEGIPVGFTFLEVEQYGTPNRILEHLQSRSVTTGMLVDTVQSLLSILVQVKVISKTVIETPKPMNYNEVQARGESLFKYDRYITTELAPSVTRELQFKTPDNYIRNGCCLTLLMNTLGKGIAWAKQRTGPAKRFQHIEPSPEYFWELGTGTEFPADGDYPMTLPHIGKCYSKYNVPFTVLNEGDQVVYEVVGNANNSVNLSHVYARLHNNHIYHLNNVHSLKNTYKNLADGLRPVTADNEVTPDEKYHISKVHEDDVFIENLNDILTLDLSKDYIRCFTTTSVAKLTEQLITEYKYEPNVVVNVMTNSITAISVKVGTCTISIQTFNDAPECVQDVEVQKKYFKITQSWKNRIYESIIKPSNLSQFSEGVHYYFRNYTPMPLSCTLGEIQYGEYTSVDVNKAYTSHLMELPGIPVFNVFDTVDGKSDDLEDLSFYLVRGNTIDTNLRNLVFTASYTLYPGYVLKQLPRNSFVVMKTLRPSRISPFNFREIAKDLYRQKFHDDPAEDIRTKKQFANYLVGMCGKRFNTKQASKVFLDRNEALDYEYSINGDVRTHTQHIPMKLDSLSLYIVTKKTTQELTEGFYPVQSFVYSMMRLKLYQMAAQFSEYGLPVAVKTDCLVFRGKFCIESDNSVFDNIGKFRTEVTNVTSVLPDGNKKRQISRTIRDVTRSLQKPLRIIKPIATEYIKISDEYAADDFHNIFKHHNRVFAEAMYPGCGKSYSMKSYAKTLPKDDVLFVAPQNKQVDALRAEGFNACTVCDWLGLSLQSGTLKAMRQTKTNYKVIIFDEFESIPLSLKVRIDMVMKMNKHIQFLANGDLKQLEPIEDLTLYNNVKDLSVYLNKVSRMMFPTRYTLQIVKRVPDTDRRIFHSIHDDCFINNLSTADIIRKYTKPIYNLEDTQGVAITYLNSTAKKVGKVLNALRNSHERQLNVGNMKAHVGQTFICRSHHGKGNDVLHTNFRYEVVNILPTLVTLTDGAKNYDIPHKVLNEKFVYDFAMTGHASQGETLEGAVTICDWEFQHVSRKWLYVALTRSRSPTNMYAYYSRADVLPSISSPVEIQNKIQRYMCQDQRAERDCCNFITCETVEYMLRNPFCSHCKCSLDHDNWTLDRLDNDLSHTAGNCVLSCLHCNVRKLSGFSPMLADEQSV